MQKVQKRTEEKSCTQLLLLAIGSDQMKKAQKKLTLSKIDFLSSVIIIGLD